MAHPNVIVIDEDKEAAALLEHKSSPVAIRKHVPPNSSPMQSIDRITESLTHAVPVLATDPRTGDVYYAGFRKDAMYLSANGFVLLKPANPKVPGGKPRLGELLCFWITKDRVPMVEVRRVLFPEELPSGRRRFHAAAECLPTNDIEEIPFSSVTDVCTVEPLETFRKRQSFPENAYFYQFMYDRDGLDKTPRLPTRLLPVQISPRLAQLGELGYDPETKTAPPVEPIPPGPKPTAVTRTVTKSDLFLTAPPPAPVGAIVVPAVQSKPEPPEAEKPSRVLSPGTGEKERPKEKPQDKTTSQAETSSKIVLTIEDDDKAPVTVSTVPVKLATPSKSTQRSMALTGPLFNAPKAESDEKKEFDQHWKMRDKHSRQHRKHTKNESENEDDSSESGTEPPRRRLRKRSETNTVQREIQSNLERKKKKPIRDNKYSSKSSSSTVGDFIVSDNDEEAVKPVPDELDGEVSTAGKRAGQWSSDDDEELLKDVLAESRRTAALHIPRSTSDDDAQIIKPSEAATKRSKQRENSGSDDARPPHVKRTRVHDSEPKSSLEKAQADAGMLHLDFALKTRPIRESFCVYMQFLLSQLIDQGFIDSLEESDEYFWSAVKRIEGKVKDYKEMAIRSSVWEPTFKRDLETYAEYHSFPPSHAAGTCEACNRSNHSASQEIRLQGPKYDAVNLWNDTRALSNLFPEPERLAVTDGVRYGLGSQCHKRTEMFHRLHHFKYKLTKTIYNELRKCTETEAPKKLDYVMDNDEFVNSCWDDFQAMTDACTSYTEDAK